MPKRKANKAVVSDVVTDEAGNVVSAEIQPVEEPAFLVKKENGVLLTNKGNTVASLFDVVIKGDMLTMLIPRYRLDEVAVLEESTINDMREKVVLFVQQERRGSESLAKALESVEKHRDNFLSALMRVKTSYDYMSGHTVVNTNLIIKEKAEKQGKIAMLRAMPEGLLRQYADSQGVSDVLSIDEIIDALVERI